MIDKLTHSDFSPHLKTIFSIYYTKEDFLEAQLIQVDIIGTNTKTPDLRQAFSLLFYVEDGGKGYLQQRMYEFRHPEMGTFELFLVPLGPDETGFCYEVVFT